MGQGNGSDFGREFRGWKVVSGLIAEAVLSKRPVCLDTPAVIAYLQGADAAAYLVAPILEHPRVTVVISTISFCEVLVGPAMTGDEVTLRRIKSGLRRLPRLTVVSFDVEHAVAAAEVRGQTGLKLPDAGIVATARLASAMAIIGNDRRWQTKPLGVPYFQLNDLISTS